MWSLLSRVPLVGDARPLPQSLTEPIAIARRLCADEVKKAAPAPTSALVQDDRTAGQKTDQTKTDASAVDAQSDKISNKLPTPPSTQSAANSFMTFFTSNPFAAPRTSLSVAVESDDTKSPVPLADEKPSDRDGTKTDLAEDKSTSDAPATIAVPSDSETSPAARAQRILHAPIYSLWALLVVALISFLLGSLLRSLLSPADFIYMSDNSARAEAQAGGWREVKRLVEVKYILGGWDFVIAVVRRP